MSSFAISIPVGEYHPFLPFCLKSLMAQEPCVEIALLDASGDERVRDLADRYAHALSYRRHGPDEGQSAGIVEGWENTQGEVLGWLNADDFLFPDALARALQMFEGGTDIVCGHSIVVDDSGATTGYHWGVEEPGPLLLTTNTISQPSCFFRRVVCEQVGGLNTDLHYTMDWDLWIRLYKNDAKFKFVDETFSQVMWGRNTKTASFSRLRRQEIQAIITRYASPEEREQILQSFARESRIDRLPIALLRTLAARALARGRPVVHGLSGIGEFTSTAEISLVHYQDRPAQGLKIDFADVSAIDEVILDGEVQEFDQSKRVIFLRKCIPPATVVNLKFVVKPNRIGRFIKAEWV